MMKNLFLTSALIFNLNLNASDKATYMIPAGKNLSQDVVVNLTKASFSLRKGQAKLVYQLPTEIDGPNAQKFVIRGKADTFPLSITSDKVYAHCEKKDETVSCAMNYKKNEEGLFIIDHDGASDFIDQLENISEAEKILLKQAGIALSHEAIGIITFKKKLVKSSI